MAGDLVRMVIPVVLDRAEALSDLGTLACFFDTRDDDDVRDCGLE